MYSNTNFTNNEITYKIFSLLYWEDNLYITKYSKHIIFHRNLIMLRIVSAIGLSDWINAAKHIYMSIYLSMWI